MTFTHDWVSYNIPHWEQLLGHLKGKENIRGLEIGCFEGLGTKWFCENILTGPCSYIDCIDTFTGSEEHDKEYCKNLIEIWKENTSGLNANAIIGYSGNKLSELINLGYEYNFIYVDGDHTTPSVLEDLVLSFRLLKVGGVMIIDDYQWAGHPNPLHRPQLGINSFLQAYQEYMSPPELHIGQQVSLTKLKHKL